MSGYQLSSDDIYALPPQWTDAFVQQLPEGPRDENEYENYEYENAFAPVYKPPAYADEIYAPVSFQERFLRRKFKSIDTSVSLLIHWYMNSGLHSY